jgi:hypothetical protein
LSKVEVSVDIIDRISKLHVWIGTTSKSREEFLNYFELDFSTDGDFDDPNYKVCGFCRDIGQKSYEEEFLVYEPFYKQEIDLLEIMKESDINPLDIMKAMDECKKLGIVKANAIFSYTDAKIIIPKSYNKTYN